MSDYLLNWQLSSTVTELSDNIIDVWHIDLLHAKAIKESDWLSLAAHERARADRFVFADDRRRFLLAHIALRKILSGYLQIDPALLQLTEDTLGKPVLHASHQLQQLQFNLSHSHELAILAVTLNNAVGVDVEYIVRPADYLALAKRFYSASEYQALVDLPVEQQTLGFFQAWTRKEAFIKAIGHGLSYGLEQFSVSLGPNAPARILEIVQEPTAAREWYLFSGVPATDYVMALAIKRLQNHIRAWQWSS